MRRRNRVVLLRGLCGKGGAGRQLLLPRLVAQGESDEGFGGFVRAENGARSAGEGQLFRPESI
ncbi:hypothetical protein D3C76_1348740 [compost metagenome]